MRLLWEIIPLGLPWIFYWLHWRLLNSVHLLKLLLLHKRWCRKWWFFLAIWSIYLCLLSRIIFSSESRMHFLYIVGMAQILIIQNIERTFPPKWKKQINAVSDCPFSTMVWISITSLDSHQNDTDIQQAQDSETQKQKHINWLCVMSVQCRYPHTTIFSHKPSSK